jgi:hypothetical protein
MVAARNIYFASGLMLINKPFQLPWNNLYRNIAQLHILHEPKELTFRKFEVMSA